MKKVLFVIILVGVVSIFSGLSHAESYISGYVGAVIPHDSDADDNLGLGLSGEMTFDAGVAVGAKLGYWFSKQNIPYFGLEIDLNGNFAETDELEVSGVGDADLEADVESYSISVNALLRYPGKVFTPYAGVGIGWFYADVDDLTVIALPLVVLVEGDDDSTLGWQLLAGVDWFVNPQMSVFVEYKYSVADLEFELVDVDYEASQIYGGISLHF
jgi:opacity protein-like surface antigen